MTSSRSSLAFILRCSLLFLFSLSCAANARGQFAGSGQQDEPEFAGADIIAVNFEGNHQISSDELATVTATNVTGAFSRAMYYWWPLFFLKSFGEPYQTLEFSTIQRDTQAIDRYYWDRGFLDARSSFRVSRNMDDEKAFSDYIRQQRLMKSGTSAEKTELPEIRDTVTFMVSEGEPYTISRVAVVGLESLPNQFLPDLTENMTIKTGVRWSRAVAAKEVQRLMSILIENGYPNVRYDSLVVQHTQGLHKVNVLVYFHPGNRYRYGPAHIVFDSTSEEKSRVANNVILAQLYTDSGHWYQLSAVQRSEASLYKLGAFDLARISLDTAYINRIPDSLRDSAIIPVQVFLRMKQRWDISPSVYVGQSASQGLVFGLSGAITNTNLFQAADNLNAQGSWQPYPLTQLRYSGNIDYLRPYIGLGRLPLIMGIGYSLQIQDFVRINDSSVIHAYNQISYTAHLGTIIILSKTDNRTSLNPDGQIAYILSTGDTAILDSLPKTQINLLPSITYQDDRTNDPFNPTSGDFLSALLEVGIPSQWLFGQASSNYIKISPEIKNYFDLSDHGYALIATRLRFGFSWMLNLDSSKNDPSFDHRFYGGGGSSERGWGERELIVSDDPTRPPDQGGYNDLEANIELRFAPFQYPAGEFTSWHKLSSPIRIVLFYDAGNVWDNIVQQNIVHPNLHELSISQISQTIGLGLRYNLSFVSLRIDCGFKLYDPSGTFSSDPNTITPASKGLWLFSRPSNIPLVSFGKTCNLSFGIGQSF